MVDASTRSGWSVAQAPRPPQQVLRRPRWPVVLPQRGLRLGIHLQTCQACPHAYTQTQHHEPLDGHTKPVLIYFGQRLVTTCISRANHQRTIWRLKTAPHAENTAGRPILRVGKPPMHYVSAQAKVAILLTSPAARYARSRGDTRHQNRFTSRQTFHKMSVSQGAGNPSAFFMGASFPVLGQKMLARKSVAAYFAGAICYLKHSTKGARYVETITTEN